jgi:hypothetical protein
MKLSNNTIKFSCHHLVFKTRFSIFVCSEGKNDPKIYTKDGSVHIRSGDNGNIVFEHPSPAGKVIVAGQELVRMLQFY